MGLDLPQVVGQIEGMASQIEERRRQWQEKRRLALDTLSRAEAGLEGLKQKIALARTSYLVAGVGEGLARACPPPPLPPRFSVLSTDGSHIAPDRHSPARCYLINIGTAYLRYGDSPTARLFSQPTLSWKEEDLAIPDPAGVRDVPVEGLVLEMKRTVEEVRQVAAQLPELGRHLPCLVLLDGPLTLWGVGAQGLPDCVREALLERGLLPALDQLFALAQTQPLALGGYISHSRSTEVVNALRIALCPYDIPHCEATCRGRDRPCTPLDGMEDRFLYEALLSPGERSPLFSSSSSVARQYREHRAFFFYLKGEEVARVEVPAWVAQDGERLGLAHALTWDQARRGRGYPVALMEAHQQAVLTGADREAFWHLMEGALGRRGPLPLYSPKRNSKRLPWV